MSVRAELSKKLGYEHKEASLLQCALRHRSVGQPNNERLEYLGDSLLNMIIAEKLYFHFPKAHEGQLTRLRAMLVNRATLAELALELKLDELIELGVGEKKSGGFRRESILADAMEAIFASIYLDSDLASLKKVIDKLYETKWTSLSLKKMTKDPKTTLQEWLQAHKKPLPHYRILSSEVEGQESVFVIQCEVQGLEPIISEGRNRREGEQKAAQCALERLYEH